MKTSKHLALILSIGTGVLLVSGCAAPAAPSVSVPNTIQIQDAGNNNITVSGSEKVKVVPDIADIELGVGTQSPDAVACQEENSKEVNRVLELLKTSGVPETSIQTNGYNLSPRYDWSDNKQTIIGYEMTTNITVSALPLDQVGKLLSDCVNAGANYITSVGYRSGSYDASYQEALKLAIQAATVKAEAMAAAAGKTLGTVSGMEEIRSNTDVRYTNYRTAAKQEMAAGDVAVMPGEMDIEAEVVVTFELH